MIILEDAFWSAFAALGFAMLFNVPRRTLIACAFAGAIGHASRTLLIQSIGLTIETATFVAAALVGFLGTYLAKHLRAPSLIFTVTGVIPMVPGLFAYTAMLRFLELSLGTGDETILQEAMVYFIRTMLILGALALGISLPRLLFLRRRPVV
ncbi:MAG: hypothetical protein CUN56_13935 [Phototrophicales bacterium]|nr:MAG: hypothetical protein CUN56_13935 [Phototrophicales bacterium]RMG70173.1 MAG: threonine/serine exporter [Chloroflexota bacterium]